MTRLVNDIVTRLYLNSAWRDISDDVRAVNGVTGARGRRSEDDTTPPQVLTAVLDNTSGDYTERDPMGQWYGHIGRNTLFEQSLRLARDTCSATVSSGWGSTELDDAAEPAWTAYAWSRSGGSASDFNKASGKATHLNSTANSVRISYLPDFDQREVDVTLTLSLAFTNVLVAPISVGVLFRGQSLADYYNTVVVLNTDETITIDFLRPDGTSLTSGPALAGISHDGTPLHIRTQIEGRSLRAKVWHGTVRDTTEPYDWVKTFTDENGSELTGALIDSSGYVGIISSVAAGNTNVPITFSYDDIDIRSPQFAGEVSEWPQARDITGVDRTVEIRAEGLKRRLTQGASPEWSALRRWLQSSIDDYNPFATPRAYWSLEDGPQAVTLAVKPTTGSGSLYFVPPTTGTTPGRITWGAAKDLPGSLQSPTLTGGGSLVGAVPGLPDTGWGIAWVERMSTESGSYTQFDTANGAIVVGLIVDPGTPNVLNVYLTSAPFTGLIMTVTFADEAAVDDVWHTYYLRAEQSGADVIFLLDVDGALADSYTQTTLTLNKLGRFQFSSPASASTDTAIGHIGLWDSDVSSLDIHDASLGFPGELALLRLHRLCRERGVEFDWFGWFNADPDGNYDSPPMGPQRVDTLIGLLEDCAAVDGGILYEQRTLAAFQYRTLRTLLSRAAWATLSMTGTADEHELSGEWAPTSDDRNVNNEVSARRVEGGEYVATLDGGRMSTLPPDQGGIGRYVTSVTLNVEADGHLRDQAEWRVHLGTIDEERYPAVEVELSRDAVRASATNPDLYHRLLDLDIGDRIDLAGLDSTGIYGTREQIVIGLERTLTRFTHRLVMTCAPASAFRTLVLDDADFGRLDSSSSSLDVAATSGATTLSVVSTAERWTTDGALFPFDLVLGGEEVACSAIGSASPTFVDVGTAAHANNGPVTPGLPTGHTAGDLLLVMAAIRASGAAAPFTPAGYTLLADFVDMRVFGKYDNGSEAAPTVSFSASIANATCSAVMACFRGASLQIASPRVITTSGSAQDIAFPLISLVRGATTLVLHVGWKQDDWTSVATLSGATEISETSSTLGDDQGLVWDYRINVPAQSDLSTHQVAAGSFVVTGGAAAITRGGAFALYGTQAFTVTRASNGVAKAHTAGTEVHLAHPSIVSL